MFVPFLTECTFCILLRFFYSSIKLLIIIYFKQKVHLKKSRSLLLLVLYLHNFILNKNYVVKTSLLFTEQNKTKAWRYHLHQDTRLLVPYFTMWST